MTATPLSNPQPLSGWGRVMTSVANFVPAHHAEEMSQYIRSAGSRGVLARGLGRSYGDAAQSGGATVFDMTTFNNFTLDPETMTVTADAGASIDSILREIVPLGFFVPVTAGTRLITVGGAIAADIHGKNHHLDGSFGAHVLEITLIDGLGDIRVLTPPSPEFWATIGGMGLTGVIVSATFTVIPIQSSYISVDTERGKDLNDVMSRMVERDDEYKYSVAWIDSVATSGRGVITRGDHASLEECKLEGVANPYDYDPKKIATAPGLVPSGLLNRWSIRAFNEAWFRKHPAHREGELQGIGGFFHPLDGVQEWNRIYGPKGFLQYQFQVPDSAGYLVELALRKLREVGTLSFLTVLKRFGPGNEGMLSFPQPGWTLAVDIPAGIPALGRTLDELDALVAAEGGRLYLAKDSRQSPSMFARTYPRLDEWREIRDRIDPHHVFVSDLSRRLAI
jgi:decaprenylphospho-beta-D-ribofuranose 2-oxidase